ncbi:hydrogenase expression/formation C-terminal domain-containing protein [Halomonas sp. V046]|uniref:hydrogenase expression/formation C-terminal domain-containing protein n=1 Tax=Halomonas sp. V046 TaxID=3459611 RepID=UPI004044854F
MTQGFMRPPIGFGPGSQPDADDQGELDYLAMPSGMRTFEPHYPDVDDPQRIAPARKALRALARLAATWTPGGENLVFHRPPFDAENARVFAQALGEGEVAIRVAGRAPVDIQESVFAGVWRVMPGHDPVGGPSGATTDRVPGGAVGNAIDCTIDSAIDNEIDNAIDSARDDVAGDVTGGRPMDASGQAGEDGNRDRIEREYVEIGLMPTAVLRRQAARIFCSPPAEGGVVNGPHIVSELLEQCEGREQFAEPYAINLSLLPHSPEDLAYLDAALGKGEVTMLSRGYGNCRIESTAIADVWRVRYYNSQDALILDIIEVSAVPDVACAAPEDLADSAVRLQEVSEAMA